MPTEKTLRHQAIEGQSEILVAATDVTGTFHYRFPRESNEAHRWRCLKRNMRYDSRLDRELAQSLLNKARKLERVPAKDMAELEEEFRERFGAEQPQAPSRPGRFRGDE